MLIDGSNLRHATKKIDSTDRVSTGSAAPLIEIDNIKQIIHTKAVSIKYLGTML